MNDNFHFQYQPPPRPPRPLDEAAKLRRAKSAFERWKTETGGWSYAEFLRWWKDQPYIKDIT